MPAKQAKILISKDELYPYYIIFEEDELLKQKQWAEQRGYKTTHFDEYFDKTVEVDPYWLKQYNAVAAQFMQYQHQLEQMFLEQQDNTSAAGQRQAF